MTFKYSIIATVLLAATITLAQEKKEKPVERKPAAAPAPTPAPAPAAQERRTAPPPAHPAPTPRPDVQRRSAPSHMGSIHYAEQRERRSPPTPTVDIHDTARLDTSHVNLNVRTRPPVGFGVTVRSLPRNAREVNVRDRHYYVNNDHYYRPYRFGDELRYIATRPPIGAYIHVLPSDYQVEVFGGRRFYVAGGIYYEDSTYEGAPAYVVAEPPLGATLDLLPDNYETIYFPGGRRLIRASDYYYSPVMRGGTVEYVRVASPDQRLDVVNGTVAFADRPPIVEDMEIDVRLLDISEPGSMPEIVAEQTITQPDAVPVPFELNFDPSAIDPSRIYAVDAQVRAGGEVRWATRTAMPVLNGRPNSVQVVVEPGGG